jgi:hypothetical protein
MTVPIYPIPHPPRHLPLGPATEQVSSRTSTDLTTAYPTVIIGDAPILYYRLNEHGEGTTVYDSSGNGNHGFRIGVWEYGVPGLLLGDSDTGWHNPRVSAVDASDPTDPGGLNCGRIFASINPFVNGASQTFEQWIEYDSDASAISDVFESADNSVCPQFVTNPDTHQILFLTSGASIATWNDQTEITQSNRIHLVLTVTQAGASFSADLWIDGVHKGGRSRTGTYSATPGNIVYGDMVTGTAVIKGVIDEIAIYDYKLTDDQIREHFTVGSGETPVVEVPDLSHRPLVPA